MRGVVVLWVEMRVGAKWWSSFLKPGNPDSAGLAPGFSQSCRVVVPPLLLIFCSSSSSSASSC